MAAGSQRELGWNAVWLAKAAMGLKLLAHEPGRARHKAVLTGRNLAARAERKEEVCWLWPGRRKARMYKHRCPRPRQETFSAWSVRIVGFESN